VEVDQVRVWFDGDTTPVLNQSVDKAAHPSYGYSTDKLNTERQGVH